MKKFVVVVFLCLSAFGQSLSSGGGIFAGAGAQSAGAPQTYAARTDRCVLGYALDTTNCVNGATTGKAGSAMAFLGQTGDPMPWYQTPGTIDPVNTAITDPDFNSYQVMATSGTWGNSIGLGTIPTQTFNEQAGEWDPFSQDNSLLLVANNEGGYALVALDVSLIHAKSCAPQQPSPAPNTSCVVWTGISTNVSGDSCTQGSNGTGCTLLNSNGEFSFSRAPGEAHVIYELMGSGSGAQVQINKLLVTCPSGAPGTWGSNSCSFARTPYVNFTSNSPANCSVLPAGFTSNSPWMGAFSVANDGTVGYVAGGAGDWQASMAYNYTVPVDAFVYPTMNNSSKNAFQATTSGTSGTSEPNWGTACNTAGSTCADGTITWTNIGKIGGQGPGFDVLYFSPTRGCRRLNTITGYILNGTNENADYPGTGGSVSAAGQMQTDSVPALFNSCLNQFDSCTGNVCKPPSGSYSNYTTTGSPGNMCSSCTQGQIGYCQSVATAGIGPLTDQGTLHDGGIKVNPRYLPWSPTGGGSSGGSFVNQAESCRGSGSSYTEESCFNYVWDVTTNIVRPEHTWVDWNGTDINGQSDGHEIAGYNGNWKGGFSQFHNYSEPNFPNVSDFNSTSNCDSVLGGSLSSGPCSIGSVDNGMPLLLQSRSTGVTGAPWDEHGADRVSNSTDTVPVFLFNTAVPAMGRTAGSGYPGSLPGYNEITGMATQLVSGCSSTIATYCQYRFAHNWGTGSVPQFNGQNEQGMNSQDGILAAVASDVMGTRGSVSPDWKSAAWTYGVLINPVCSSGCTNAMHSSFQQMSSAGCTAGGTEPSSWPQTPGSTISDGSCTWENVSGMYGSEQLPCNGLRADILATAGATIYQNTNVFELSNSTIFRAVSCTPVAPATSCSFPITEGTVPSWSGCSTFGSQCTDAAGIVFQNIGQNDCRTDVILVDLMSAKSR
ncbi:MAG: hypothetical protein WA172_00470 [Terriglobales bacterium]